MDYSHPKKLSIPPQTESIILLRSTITQIAVRLASHKNVVQKKNRLQALPRLHSGKHSNVVIMFHHFFYHVTFFPTYDVLPSELGHARKSRSSHADNVYPAIFYSFWAIAPQELVHHDHK